MKTLRMWGKVTRSIEHNYVVDGRSVSDELASYEGKDVSVYIFEGFPDRFTMSPLPWMIRMVLERTCESLADVAKLLRYRWEWDRSLAIAARDRLGNWYHSCNVGEIATKLHVEEMAGTVERGILSFVICRYCGRVYWYFESRDEQYVLDAARRQLAQLKESELVAMYYGEHKEKE